MSLAAGTKLGAYEILAPLGAGGMGEVYRARDPKLARDVAVKVLPGDFLEGEERKQRFEREARLLAALNHPGIAAIYSFEEIPLSSSSIRPVLVMELLEGETLRARLGGGALPVRKAIDYAVQIAKGLAAAHEKGIVHRDLKPENLFVTKDGRVKILDFGLAKLRAGDGPAGVQTNLPTAEAGTEPGVVLGTLGYMSPEQVKGQPTDQRSDLFSFGAILYEMLSGARAFHRASGAETISAILREDPPDLSTTNRGVAPGLERIVRHCLEKNPEERFYSARDLAFDLEALSSLSGPEASAAASAESRRLSRRSALAAALVAAALAGAALAWIVVRRGAERPLPSYRQLTFRRGPIWRAVFGSDGKSLLYSAEWDGGPIEVYAGRSDSPDSRPFGLKQADVFAVASGGDVAVALSSRFTGAFLRTGTLARVPAAGGGTREILEDVEDATFGPGGSEFAIVRRAGARRRLEYPIGKTILETTGWIASPRFSPRGDTIAFLDHPATGDDAGTVALVDLAGKKTTLTPVFGSASGLAWSPDGSEVWFTAAESGSNRPIRAVSTSGKLRMLATGAGAFTLQDVARDGRVLVKHDLQRVGAFGRAAPDQPERDLSWFDWSLVADFSNDGRTLVFTEAGEAGGAGYAVFLRTTDGAPAVRLGEGQGLALSPDGKRVLALQDPAGAARLAIYPTGAGETRRLEHPGLSVRSAVFLPDSRRILMTAAEANQDGRVYLFDPDAGPPKALTPPGHRTPQRVGLVDDRHFLTLSRDRAVFLSALDGGDPVPVSGIGPVDTILGATSTPGTIWLRRGNGLPAHVVRFDLKTGREETYRDFMPADPTGVVDTFGIRVTPDGRAYAASYGRILSDLFVIEGLK